MGKSVRVIFNFEGCIIMRFIRKQDPSTGGVMLTSKTDGNRCSATTAAFLSSVTLEDVCPLALCIIPVAPKAISISPYEVRVRVNARGKNRIHINNAAVHNDRDPRSMHVTIYVPSSTVALAVTVQTMLQCR